MPPKNAAAPAPAVDVDEPAPSPEASPSAHTPRSDSAGKMLPQLRKVVSDGILRVYQPVRLAAVELWSRAPPPVRAFGAKMAHQLNTNKSLRVLLLTVLVAVFILYLSEMQTSAALAVIPTEQTKELIQMLDTAEKEGRNSGPAAVQLREEIHSLRTTIEKLIQTKADGSSFSPADRLAACEKDLVACKEKEGKDEDDEKERIITTLQKERAELEKKVAALTAGTPTACPPAAPASATAPDIKTSPEWKALEKENGELKAKVSDLEAKVQSAAASSAAGTPEVAGLQKENGELKGRILELEGKVKAAEAAEGSVPGVPQVSVLEKEKSELKAKVAELEAKVQAGGGEGGGGGGGGAEEVEGLKKRLEESEALYERVMTEKRALKALVADYSQNCSTGANTAFKPETEKVLEAAKKAIAECGQKQASSALSAAGSKSYECTATDDDLKQYLNYKPRAQCPDDWYFIQRLIYEKSCFCLPRRRCFAPSPPNYREPTIPFPQSLFDPKVLSNDNVRWGTQYWPSYEAINSRKFGDCRDCFNLTLEAYRWKMNFQGTISMDDMLALKGKGAIKIGLDAGGGTGSFAAKMAERGATIVTTAKNTETLDLRDGGLPYMETIAQRGLIPLHVPHAVRQPFFDNTLDIVHAINSIKYFTIPEFEELLFEWDRILRPGGILWFELFYAPENEMPLYLAVVDLFRYKKLYWNMTPKTDAPERDGAHIYLNCVLEKPRRPDTPPQLG